MKAQQNTFTAFLKLLKVKHTSDFSNKFFNEHPHKYNMFGLSKMLSDYGIRNAGTRIEDKENDIFKIECPFVAHSGGDFVVVEKIPTPKSPEGDLDSESFIHCLRNGKKITIPVSQFIQSWSGVILLADTTPNSIEPEYKEHRKKEFFNIAQKSILFLAGTLIFGIAYINQILSYSIIQSLSYSILLTLNLIGIYISYLLVLKQMHIQSSYADKICSLFSKSDCNNVLESNAAKLFGIFGWSEIGLGYFTANVLLLLFFQQTVHLLALINIFALPYSFWSVWYQKVKARQWCPLCLIVQVLLWSIFIVNCIFGYIQIQLFSYSIIQLLFVCSFFAGLILTFNLVIPNLSSRKGMEQITQEINGIKANEEVFKAILKEQPFYKVCEADSQVLFGNPNANLVISILTNPFCNPCARMHKRVEKLLQETNRNLCVQYLFSSFQPDLEFAVKYLIAAYFKHCHGGLDPSSSEQIISDWFEKGKPLKEAFFENMQLDITNPAVEAEFQKHNAWKEKTQLRATPTVLVNGYKLPDNYKIEDLKYFTEFNFDVK